MNPHSPDLLVLVTRQFDHGRSALPDAPVVPERPARSFAPTPPTRQVVRLLRQVAHAVGQLADRIERPVRAA